MDLSDPLAPREVAALLDTPGKATALAIEGEHVYMADGSGGLQIYQITGSPLAPFAGW